VSERERQKDACWLGVLLFFAHLREADTEPWSVWITSWAISAHMSQGTRRRYQSRRSSGIAVVASSRVT
jgi:hypothetical protein